MKTLTSIMIILFTFFELSNAQPKLNQEHEWELDFSIQSLSFSSDGLLLASADSLIQIWQIPGVSGRENIKTLSASSAFNRATFSPDSKYLVGGDNKGTIFIWDCKSWKMVKKLSLHTGAISALEFSPDGNILASGDANGLILIWETSTWKNIKKLSEAAKRITSLAFSPNGNYLAVSKFKEENIFIWDTSTWEEDIKTYEDNNEGGYFHSIAYSPNGDYLVGGKSNGKVIVFHDATTTFGINMKEKLTDHLWNVYDVAFSPNSKYLVSSSWDKTLIFWEISSYSNSRNKIQLTHSDLFCVVAFNPNGKYLATGDSNKLIIYSINPPMAPVKDDEE